MFKRNLVCVTLGGMVLGAATAFAAIPAVPPPTTPVGATSTTIANPSASATVTNPSIEQVQWRRGPGWGGPSRWHRARWRNRRWWGGRWHYW